MSDTPRTDEFTSREAYGGYISSLVWTTYARTLERELALAKAENERLRHCVQRAIDGITTGFRNAPMELEHFRRALEGSKRTTDYVPESEESST